MRGAAVGAGGLVADLGARPALRQVRLPDRLPPVTAHLCRACRHGDPAGASDLPRRAGLAAAASRDGRGGPLGVTQAARRIVGAPAATGENRAGVLAHDAREPWYTIESMRAGFSTEFAGG